MRACSSPNKLSDHLSLPYEKMRRIRSYETAPDNCIDGTNARVRLVAMRSHRFSMREDFGRGPMDRLLCSKMMVPRLKVCRGEKIGFDMGILDPNK